MAIQHFTKVKSYALFSFFYCAKFRTYDLQQYAIRRSSSLIVHHPPRNRIRLTSSLVVFARAVLSRLPKQTKRQRSDKMAALDKGTDLDMADKGTVFHAKLDEVFPGSLLEGQFVSKAAGALKVCLLCVLYVV